MKVHPHDIYNEILRGALNDIVKYNDEEHKSSNIGYKIELDQNHENITNDVVNCNNDNKKSVVLKEIWKPKRLQNSVRKHNYITYLNPVRVSHEFKRTRLKKVDWKN